MVWGWELEPGWHRGCFSPWIFKQHTTKLRPSCQSGRDPSQQQQPAPVAMMSEPWSKFHQILWQVGWRGSFVCSHLLCDSALKRDYIITIVAPEPSAPPSTSFVDILCVDLPIQTKTEHSNILASRKRKTTVAAHYSQTCPPHQSPAKKMLRL